MTTCGVVLAAGEGRRFGGLKQLAPLDGRPLLQHALDPALTSPVLDRVVLVLGADADRVRGAVDTGRAEVVVCEGWREGMSASLRAAFAAAAGAEWLVVVLGDEPDLPAEAIATVVARARAAPAGVAAVRASWQGRPGHPVALRGALAPMVERLRGDVGARALGEVAFQAVELGHLGGPRDVDRPADLAVPPRPVD